MTQTLRFIADGIADCCVSIPDGSDGETVAAGILAIPEIDAAIRATIVRHVYPLYSRDGGLEQSDLNAAANAFLDSGQQGLAEWGRSMVDEDRRIDEVERDVVADDRYRVIAEAAIQTIAEATGENPDIENVFGDGLRERVEEVVERTDDTSTPQDLIGKHDDVMVCYAPAYEFGIEDDAILGRKKSIRPTDVELVTDENGPRLPDGILAYLHLVNADPVALRQHFLDSGVVLTGLDAEVKGHGPAWARADWGYDPAKPSLHDAHTVLTVFENAGDCVIPTLTMRVSLRQLIAHDFGNPARIVPTGKGKAYAGFVNFVHGAGYDAPVREAVEVPAGRDKWLCADTNAWSYRTIFGIVSDAYTVDLTTAA